MQIERFVDVRCTNGFKGLGGGACGQLLFRVSTEMKGTVEIQCRRCGQVQTLRIGAAKEMAAAS